MVTQKTKPRDKNEEKKAKDKLKKMSFERTQFKNSKPNEKCLNLILHCKIQPDSTLKLEPQFKT